LLEAKPRPKPSLERRTIFGEHALTPLLLQIDVGHGRKAIVIFVPVPLLPNWHKIQQRYEPHRLHCWSNELTCCTRLTRELEKKFSDRHVIILASRRILPRPKRATRSRSNQKQKRPRSRTLKAVHEAIMIDLVYPVEIVGRRILQREDGSQTLKIILDEKERGSVDYRLETYKEVYKRLTGAMVNFEFPLADQSYHS
jgi:small subunit ribosomal protein S7e